MATLTLYHNPRCSKSRRALELLRERDAQIEIVEYIKDPPSRADLTLLVGSAGEQPAAFVRTGDAAFRDAGLELPDAATVDEVVDVLCDHPELMQRPLAVSGGTVVICRPPERVLDLLGGS